MKTMRLTDHEVDEILKIRAEIKHDKATRAFQIKSIQVAAEYFEWCKTDGFYTPNFGTFLNSFCYEGADAKQMQEAVKKIWELVWSLELPKEKQHE